ncbi:MAG: alanine--glyoxylate aminotransferase family protein, partial [Thermoleophilia bacterium]|nr:alanine--glyoxylate aminotransferase family protein [Thermoleophilia bacterium]
MPEKRYLLTPGPTPVPPPVLAAMSQPIIAHRGSDFRRLAGEVLERLAKVFRTADEVLLFTSSGTGAMESSIANLCSPGDRVVPVSAGHFGERWTGIAAAYGCDVQPLRYGWGETPSPEDLAAHLRELGGAQAVFLTHSETSTGVVCDVEALAEVARAADVLVAVDAISSLGAVPVEPREWGLDVVVTGSQKALMTPPGLAMASVSPAAWEACARAASPRFYFDWQRAREAQERPQTPFTPAISIVMGLNVALQMLLDEGLENVFERHRRLGRACREGVKVMGLELFSPDDDRSAVVTAIRMPERIDGQQVVHAVRDRLGVTVAGGQG